MQEHLVDVVNDYCLRRLGTLPDLVNPTGYNDKINWLKIHDQMPEHIVCCDKLRVREYVAERVGTDCLLEIYQTAPSIDRIDFETLPDRYVLKTNHDSGSVYVVTDKASSKNARKKIRRRLKRTYGVMKGEWAYAHITPHVFAEECMHRPVIDYKFHCALGQVLWVQLIADRDSGMPKETIVDEHYATLPLHMDHKMLHEPQVPPQPATWDRMKDLARTLSEPFRYVRVDLYHYRDRPVFGELTFWPLAGCYKTKDEPVFGKMLEVDIGYKRPTIHDALADQERSAMTKVLGWVTREWRAMNRRPS